MNFSIRPAVPNDIPDILKLTYSGIHIWGEDIVDKLKTYHLDVTCSYADMTARFNDRNNLFFVAELDGKTVGTVYVNIENGETAHMGGLYCSIRGGGLGTTLLRHAMDQASNAGSHQMECTIYENNIPSISLMKKYGANYCAEEVWDDVRYVSYRFDLSRILVSA